MSEKDKKLTFYMPAKTFVNFNTKQTISSDIAQLSDKQVDAAVKFLICIISANEKGG